MGAAANIFCSFRSAFMSIPPQELTTHLTYLQCAPVNVGLTDRHPYVRRTAVMGVLKIYHIDANVVIAQGGWAGGFGLHRDNFPLIVVHTNPCPHYPVLVSRNNMLPNMMPAHPKGCWTNSVRCSDLRPTLRSWPTA